MPENKKIKMILNGALGRMGCYVLDAVLDTNDIEIIQGVDPSVTDAANNYKGVNLVSNIDEVLNEDIDVVVDFTNSEVTMDIVNKCKDNNVDLIIGSTGFTQSQINELKNIADNSHITVFLVPNFSIGANLLMKAVENISNYYDYVDVTEMHHENKVDSPSGTAMSIAESISKGIKSGKFSIYGNGIFVSEKLRVEAEKIEGEIIEINKEKYVKKVDEKDPKKVLIENKEMKSY